MIQPLWWRAFSVLVTWLFVAQACAPLASAQAGTLQVVILQPGEGETYYTGPGGPRTLVPILGRASSDSFDPQQLEIQLDLLQGGKLIGHESGASNADGTFSFRVLINAEGSGELSTPEMNCFSCHEMAKLALPAGASSVRVTAVEPTGRKAVAERRVMLDKAGLAAVAVEVGVRDQPGWSVVGLPVIAATRVYDWRGRKFSALTDAGGRAAMQIEALTLAPTRYLFSVAPTVVDGIRYQSTAPVEVVLPANARAADPIQLTVEAQFGQISGSVALAGQPPAGPLSVRAVELSYGRSFSAPAVEGRFALDGLPIGVYLVGADPDQAAALKSRPVAVRLDLTQQTQAAVTLALTPLTGRSAQGAVRDTSGTAIPFAWITESAQGPAMPVSPASGAFALHGLARGATTVRVNAPGFWSRTIPARAGLAVTLKPRPDTRVLPWGAGALVIPDTTNGAVAGERITLRRGWLWGVGDRPLTIGTPEATVTVQGGRFALEYLPGESAWLYVFAGAAVISARGEPDVAVQAGEMCAFAGKEIAAPRPVPFDEAAARSLRALQVMPAGFVAEPGWQPRTLERLAAIGIPDVGLPQMALGSLLVLGGLAAMAFILARVRRRRMPARGTEQDDDDGGTGSTIQNE